MWSWFKKSNIYDKRSSSWPKVRSEHLKKQPCCQCCGSCIKPEVHHIIPVSIDPAKELDPNNLITLCDKYCHFIFGHLMDWKSYNIDIVKDSKDFFVKKKNSPK